MFRLMRPAIAAFALASCLMGAAKAPEAGATLGGGCFWCLEAAFEQLKGVGEVENGYAGGHTVKPSYQQVCAGNTGHAEVVRIHYDPRVISYRDLLRAFFVIHDPTTPNRQGADVGAQYRSIILTHDASQLADAKAVIAELTRARAFSAPIVTELQPLKQFYRAEAYHQNYFAQHPDQPYCALVVAPKLEKLKHRFFDRLKR